MDKIINLNVGGKLYTTSLTTLTKYPDSMLARMFSGDFLSTQDAEGHYVIDRDGKLFRFILAFLRSSQLVLPDDFTELDMLIEEAEFFQIDALSGALKGCQELQRPSPSSDVYKLNVGGIVYPVLRKYLEPTEETIHCHEIFSWKDQFRVSVAIKPGRLVLGNLWGTINSPNAIKDENGHYIIDGDGKLFRFILNFVRTKRLNLPYGFSEFQQLKAEMKRLDMNIDFVSFLEFQTRAEGYSLFIKQVRKRWPALEGFQEASPKAIKKNTPRKT